jgi:hypothetical protein
LAEEFRRITKKEMQNIIETYKNSLGRRAGNLHLLSFPFPARTPSLIPFSIERKEVKRQR